MIFQKKSFNIGSSMSSCRYCIKRKKEASFECSQCRENVHFSCVDSNNVPGGLLGDVFFVFKCRYCNGNGIEQFERDKMSWTDVVLLALYNLKEQCFKVSENGYFHWDKHIKQFINAHWKTIFPHIKTKRKSWAQMILGTLKTSPQYFACGDSIVNSPSIVKKGWYRLARADMIPNQAILDKGGKTRRKRKRGEMDGFVAAVNEDSTSQDSSSHEVSISVQSLSSTIYSHSSQAFNNMYSRSYVKPTPILSDYLFAGEDTEEDVDIEATETDCAVDIRTTSITDAFTEGSKTLSERGIPSRVDLESDIDVLLEDNMETETDTDTVCDVGSTVASVLSKSLLNRNEGSTQNPWISKPLQADANCRPMAVHEEEQLLGSIAKRINNSETVSVADIRLHRKLVVRRARRYRKLPVFDLATASTSAGCSVAAAESEYRVLDRFHQRNLTVPTEEDQASFRTKLLGCKEHYTCFTSPFTLRVLKPFIRRDYDSMPLWLRLMQELQQRANRKQSGWVATPRAPIDYSYVRPHHIPAVNSLAEQYFWPGINLAECLQYPDFSCVALYKKLVVGFAFLVPDVGYNEAYISFIFTRPEWRRAGIGSYMLYHVIQTCMGRDITLHVSATNPALFLYQKFGFKVEEFIQDFYDKYLPLDSNESKHAFFLRLSR